MRYWPFVVFSLLPGLCLATEPVLETIQVKAASPQNVPGKVAVVKEKEVRDTGATHPAEQAVRAPGMWVSRGGGQEHLTALRSPVWTGPGACGELLYAEDGVPVRPSGFCNVNQMVEIHNEQSGGMEILRGVQGGAFYGANAVHGVINVLSLPLKERHSLRIEGGPYDYARAMWQEGDPNGYLAVTGTHDGGYVDSSGYDQQKISWKRRQEFSGVALTHYLTAAHLDQQSTGYLIGEDAYRDDERQRNNSKPDSWRDVDALRYVQSWDWQSGDYRYSLKPYLRRSAMDFSLHFVFPEALEENGHHSGGVQWLVRRDNFSWGSWQAGVEGELADAWTKEWQEAPSTPSSPRGIHYDYEVGMRSAAIWQEITWQLADRLDAQFGVRADRVLYDYDNRTTGGPAGKFMRPADREDGFSLLSPRVGLVYTDRYDNEWYASAATGNRAPQTGELYRLQGDQQVADIGEVVADGGEVGWRGNRKNAAGDKTAWNIVLFDMHKDNVIIRNPSNVLSDDAKTRHRGVEVSARQDWSAGWFAGITATYAEHRYDSDVFDRSDSVDSNIMDTAPRTFGSLQLGWQRTGKRVELEWVHVGDYYLNPEDTFAYEGHDLFNLRANLRLSKEWMVFARLMNIMDREYAERADVTSFPLVEPRYFVGLPRSLFLGFEWSY